MTNVIAALHGPLPALFDAWIHQEALPEGNNTFDVTLQVPPLAHPACSAVYVRCTRAIPDESFTHK